MIQGIHQTVTMDTYLRRTYAQKKRLETEDYPFWDYRSRRGAFCSSGSLCSSATSSSDGSSISSISCRSESSGESLSLSEQSDAESLLPCEQQRMSVQLLTDSCEISSMELTYLPIVAWIDPELHILNITDTASERRERVDNDMTSFPLNSAHLPGVALIVFLQENGAVGFERIQAVKRFFEKSPWKFHHSEQVQRGAINPYPYNSRDFYYTSEDLPLCAVRQVHTGKEFLRVMIFVSEANWLQMMQFYKLVLGKETDLKRDDFCMFTVCSFPSYDVQLALKKLQGDTKPRALGGVRLQFRLNDVSNIMAFLPNVCHPLSDTRWQTTDNDGNVIVLETPRFYGNSTFMDRCSLSSRGSITGRSSSSRSGSFTRPAKTGQNLQRERMRASVENKRPSGSPRAMRAHSVLVDKDLIEKIKTENKAYKELTQRAFVEHFKTLTANDVEVKRKTTDFSSANTLPVITNSFYV